MAFVNLIQVAEQSSSTARVGTHNCGHRTGAVLSSDKHWHAVLEHCLALLESYDSRTAVSAVTGCSKLQRVMSEIAANQLKGNIPLTEHQLSIVK